VIKIFVFVQIFLIADIYIYIHTYTCFSEPSQQMVVLSTIFSYILEVLGSNLIREHGFF